MKIPTDLVPLAGIARQLGTTSSRLAEQSARGEFPTCYKVAGTSWRVSQAEVEVWFVGRSAARLAEEAEVRHKLRAHRASRTSRTLDLRMP